MQLFRKYFYGDYDAIKGGKPNADAPKSEGSAVDPSPSGRSGGAEWPLWEIFIRSKQGLDHKHVGSLHAADAAMAIENARDVYTRRQEGVSIWVVKSSHIHASNPDDAESFYEPANDKVYRHPTFYDLPDELTHM
ncbi:1,2-phenylacetyl-CoA epoxidase subunit PaaB [Flaviaesturariibacter aridisoli]|uniref:1,2-phenylacetyl-CoA epoxidase subunit B n=1 Tax=Flaviaesturariibacter aridisoli TaxID=2545761 RepID=A0A4R4E1F6_9BACT|nr:1,2-phenylacetyl-CoA epoxidase subunit B [Flaviaesturariibacter aridisoli]